MIGQPQPHLVKLNLCGSVCRQTWSHSREFLIGIEAKRQRDKEALRKKGIETKRQRDRETEQQRNIETEKQSG